VRNKEGQEQPWLKYNYEGFPLISSLAKLTMMQNDIRLTESDVLTTLLGKELELESGVTESNYITLLKTEKGAYYQGENFDGSVILGRKGGAQNPNRVELTIDGRELDESEYELIPGGIKLDISAGSPGDKEIKEFCEVNFDINFPFTTITEVKGGNAHEIFKWAQNNFGKSAIPKWNFHKILINKQGNVEETYASFTKPTSNKIINKIEEIL